MKELIKQDGYIIVNCPYMEAYIPSDLFDDADKASAVACMYGEGVRCIGLFNVRCFESDEQDTYSAKLRTLNYPNVIDTYPSDIQKTTMSIDGESEPIKVHILKYYKGDILMSATSRKSAKNCEQFLNYMTRGKVPTSIPCEDLCAAWMKNFDINATNPGVPPVTIECMVATLARSKDDPLTPYRKVVNTPADKGYFMANMRQTASMTNVMAALTFEDQGAMLTTSINMCKKGIKQTYSPFEKILSM